MKITIISVLIEGLILLIGRGACSLTKLAERYYSGNTEGNFDIFLPDFVTRGYRKIVVGAFVIGLVLIVARVV